MSDIEKKAITFQLMDTIYKLTGWRFHLAEWKRLTNILKRLSQYDN